LYKAGDSLPLSSWDSASALLFFAAKEKAKSKRYLMDKFENHDITTY